MTPARKRFFMHLAGVAGVFYGNMTHSKMQRVCVELPYKNDPVRILRGGDEIWPVGDKVLVLRCDTI